GVGPAGMAVDALEPDRTVCHHGVELRRGRKAVEPPGFLVPAAADDPRALRIGRGVFGDPGLRFGKRAGVRQVDREQAETESHDMRVGVDQARNDGAAAAVFAVIRSWCAFAFAYELDDFAFVVDQHRLEAGHGAVAIDGDAV